MKERKRERRWKTDQEREKNVDNIKLIRATKRGFLDAGNTKAMIKKKIIREAESYIY